jgi:uncharacterized protein YraI
MTPGRQEPAVISATAEHSGTITAYPHVTTAHRGQAGRVRGCLREVAGVGMNHG